MIINKIKLFESREEKIYSRELEFETINFLWSEGNSYGKSNVMQAILYVLGAKKSIIKMAFKEKDNFLGCILETNKGIIYKYNESTFIKKDGEFAPIKKSELATLLTGVQFVTRLKSGIDTFNAGLEHVYSAFYMQQGRVGTTESIFGELVDQASQSTKIESVFKWLLNFDASNKRYVLEKEIRNLKTELNSAKKNNLYSKEEVEALKKKFGLQIKEADTLKKNIKASHKTLSELKSQQNKAWRKYYRMIDLISSEAKNIEELKMVRITKDGVEVSLYDFYSESTLNSDSLDFNSVIETKELASSFNKRISETKAKIESFEEDYQEYITKLPNELLIESVKDSLKEQKIETRERRIIEDEISIKELAKEKLDIKISKAFIDLERRIDMHMLKFGIYNKNSNGYNEFYEMLKRYELISNSSFRIPIMIDDLINSSPQVEFLEYFVKLAETNDVQLIATLNVQNKSDSYKKLFINRKDTELVRQNLLIDKEEDKSELVKKYMISYK